MLRRTLVLRQLPLRGGFALRHGRPPRCHPIAIFGLIFLLPGLVILVFAGPLPSASSSPSASPRPPFLSGSCPSRPSVWP